MGSIQNWLFAPQTRQLMEGLFGSAVNPVTVTPPIGSQSDYDANTAAGMYDPGKNGGSYNGGLMGGTADGQQLGAELAKMSPALALPYLARLQDMASNPAAQAELQGKQLSNRGAALNLIPLEAQIKSWLSLTGQNGGDNMAAPSQGVPSTATPPMPGAPGGTGTMPPAGVPAGAPGNVPLSRKLPVPGLPPGIDPMTARLLGPQGLTGLYSKYAEPQNLRQGGALTYYDFGSGQQKPLYQQPTLEKNTRLGADGNIEQIPGGTAATQANATAEASGKAAGEYPFQVGLAQVNSGLTQQNEGFKRGLELGTSLTPAYDPSTQTTNMITQADAVKLARGGSPITAPPPGAPAPQPGKIGLQGDGSYKTPSGTTIPAAPPPAPRIGGLQSAPSAADAATQSIYGETIKGWNDSVQPAAQAEQRFQAMGQALKLLESGAFASRKAEIASYMIAAGMDKDAVSAALNTSPAQAEILMKNNFGGSLSTLAASRLGRITQNEIFAQQKNLANPSLQPEANLAIIGQGIGIARYQQALANDWNTARQLGYADPLTYQAQWMKANPIQKFVDDATKEVGPLKGMTQGVVNVKTPEEAMKLPVGTKFRTPDGRLKVR